MPSEWIVRQFLERRQAKVTTYWGYDENGCFYILRKSLYNPSKGSNYINNLNECFAFVPIDNKSEKCLGFFFSEFNYGEGNKYILNSYIID